MGEAGPLRPTGPLAGAVVVAAVLALAALVMLVLGRTDAEQALDPFPGRFEQPTAVSVLPTGLGVGGEPNGVAFATDTLWTYDEMQFALWIDGDGSPIVGRRQGPDGDWRTADLGALEGNPLGAPTEQDTHNVYTLAVDERGIVHVAGNMHTTALRYVRSREPLAIDDWVAAGMVGSEEASVSYPAFVRSPTGGLLFFYRDGVAGHGDVVLNRLEARTGEWQRVATLVDGRSSRESPYLQRVAVDVERGRIHVMFVWRADADVETNRDVSYLASDDGGETWEGSDGAALALPVTHRRAEIVSRTDEGSPVLVNQGGMAVDGSGRPHAVFLVDDPPADDARVVHVWQGADGWQASSVRGPQDLAGRPALVGTGREPLALLWTERRGEDRSELRAAHLAGDRIVGAVALARLPVPAWEPTFDSTALAAHDELRTLLPVRASSGSARGALVTWPSSALGWPR